MVVGYVSCFVQTFGPSSNVKDVGNNKRSTADAQKMCLSMEKHGVVMMTAELGG